MLEPNDVQHTAPQPTGPMLCGVCFLEPSPDPSICSRIKACRKCVVQFYRDRMRDHPNLHFLPCICNPSTHHLSENDMQRLVDAGLLDLEHKRRVLANEAKFKDLASSVVAALPRCRNIKGQDICNAKLQLIEGCRDAYFECLECNTKRCIQCGGGPPRGCMHPALPTDKWLTCPGCGFVQWLENVELTGCQQASCPECNSTLHCNHNPDKKRKKENQNEQDKRRKDKQGSQGSQGKSMSEVAPDETSEQGPDPESHPCIWNRVTNKRVSGRAAPKHKNLANYLQTHPDCEIYDSQDRSMTAAGNSTAQNNSAPAPQPSGGLSQGRCKGEWQQVVGFPAGWIQKVYMSIQTASSNRAATRLHLGKSSSTKLMLKLMLSEPRHRTHEAFIGIQPHKRAIQTFSLFTYFVPLFPSKRIGCYQT